MVVSKKVPLRKCVATGEMLPKKSMIRVVRSKEGEVSVDVTGKKSGRGAYVSKSEQAVDIARKKNRRICSCLCLVIASVNMGAKVGILLQQKKTVMHNVFPSV